jgi:hypothetical protein
MQQFLKGSDTWAMPCKGVVNAIVWLPVLLPAAAALQPVTLLLFSAFVSLDLLSCPMSLPLAPREPRVECEVTLVTSYGFLR